MMKDGYNNTNISDGEFNSNKQLTVNKDYRNFSMTQCFRLAFRRRTLISSLLSHKVFVSGTWSRVAEKLISNCTSRKIVK